jgi:hypothetical protein
MSLDNCLDLLFVGILIGFVRVRACQFWRPLVPLSGRFLGCATKLLKEYWEKNSLNTAKSRPR